MLMKPNHGRNIGNGSITLIKLVLYENLPMQNTAFIWAVKFEKLYWKKYLFIFLLFLLKTLIVDTRSRRF